MDRPSPHRRGRRIDEQHEALIDRALAIYQPRTSRPLDREDGREMVHNLAGFLGQLAVWKRREKAKTSGAAPE